MFLFRRADRLDILLLVASFGPAAGALHLDGRGAGRARQRHGPAPPAPGRRHRAVHAAGRRGGQDHDRPARPPLAAVAAAGGLLEGVLYASLSWPRLWPPPDPGPAGLRPAVPARLPDLGAGPAGAGRVRPRPPAAATGDRPPVVMILFDEFPLSSLLDAKGRIDRRVYPNFAALADQSTWYRNATGVAGYTPWALPAMLTGNYPAEAEARLDRVPRQPVHAARPVLRRAGVRDHQPALPAQAVPVADRQPGADRAAGVVSDSARVLRGSSSRTTSPSTRPSSSTGPRHGRRRPCVQEAAAAAAQFRFRRIGRNQPARFDDFRGRAAAQRPADPALPAPAAAPRPLALPAVRGQVQLRDLRARLQERPAAGRCSGCPTSSICSRSPTPTGWSGR